MLIMPDGAVLKLEVHWNIPVLKVGNRTMEPKRATQYDVLPVAPSVIDEVADHVADDMEIPAGELEAAEEGALDEDDAYNPHVPGAREKLEAHAKSVLHKLTHLPKNPFCDACQRGKMKEK